MPALADTMYCSEQITIPPAFPYLLRQYAKAAIRTQPVDLLKWSTAYFRCLSLNIPPPVKPRLEYPIPREFHGITPGWLKALLYQLQNNLTIPFKILWDRWIGACLEHNTLIQLLCLGGFQDPQAIPWLRFVALCAGTLSDDLTHTMILICEILTEEPEGGSAIIPLETFVDLYRFLAKIDASKDQVLKNLWFRDSLLSLWRERVEKEEIAEEVQEEIVVETEQSVQSKTSSESVEKEDEKADVEKIVSCPSLPEDDQYSLDYLLKETPGEQEVEDEQPEELEETGEVMAEEGEKSGKPEESGTEGAEEDKEDTAEQIEEQKEVEPNKGDLHVEDFSAHPEETEEEQAVAEGAAEKTDEEGKEKESGIQPDGSVDTIENTQVRNLETWKVFEDDATLKEDLARLQALQQELAGETDEEVEKFKCRLIEEMPLTESREQAIKHFGSDKPEEAMSLEKIKVIGAEKIGDGEASSESQEEEGEKKSYDEVFVEAIPGIGEVVSDNLIEAVVDYMKTCAKIQHGMVMPRNIRHYNCPPLHVMDY